MPAFNPQGKAATREKLAKTVPPRSGVGGLPGVTRSAPEPHVRLVQTGATVADLHHVVAVDAGAGASAVLALTASGTQEAVTKLSPLRGAVERLEGLCASGDGEAGADGR